MLVETTVYGETNHKNAVYLYVNAITYLSTAKEMVRRIKCCGFAWIFT